MCGISRYYLRLKSSRWPRKASMFRIPSKATGFLMAATAAMTTDGCIKEDTRRRTPISYPICVVSKQAVDKHFFGIEKKGEN